ncbi:MAG: helix-turn-helix domain-containing protein [Butyricicoccus sp.]
MAFHVILREIRQQRKMKQKEVASAIGVSESTYSMYEKGIREPSIQKLRKLSSLLHVSSDDLLELPDHTEKSKPDDSALLAPFSAEEQNTLRTIFHPSFMIPPHLLLQILVLYINQSVDHRILVVEDLLSHYSAPTSSTPLLPQPNMPQIQRALELVKSYLSLN